MSSRFNRPLLLGFIGDVALLLLFSAIGRSTHHDSGALALLGIVGTAAPFLIGWTAVTLVTRAEAAAALGTVRRALSHLLWTWPIACAIGIGIRSVLEGRLVHPAFIVVALLFNLATFSVWHAVFAWVQGRRMGASAIAPA